VPGARAVDTALTAQARALYEDSAVPVREIARLSGVCERTLYKYVRKGGWQRRRRAHLDRGAGGRFVAREQAQAPHAAGLGALDAAPAMAERVARMAKARRRHALRAALRTLDILGGALVDLVRQRRERPERPERPAAERLDGLLQDAILAMIGRLARG